MDNRTVRRLVKEQRADYQMQMELRVLDGSVEEVVIARSKMEACDDILTALKEGR